MNGSRNYWPIAAAVIAALSAIIVLPVIYDEYALLQLTIYAILSVLALSLAFIWGYGGILSFGHAVFFGLGAYTYAIGAMNFGETTIALLLSMVIPALFAAALGYFLFYGRISDVYLGAITLTVTLIFFDLASSTSGPQYRIGQVALGGFNGIPSIPQLNVPGFPDWTLSTTELFILSVAILALVYISLRLLISSDFGRVVIAIKENEVRAELLGYDARKYKLVTFVIGGAIAGLAGCLFANWGGFTSPAVFALGQSVQIIIWMVVGGVGTLAGPVIGCVLMQWLTSSLASFGTVNNNLVLGGILVIVVLLLPQGLVPTIARLARGRRPVQRLDATAGALGATPAKSEVGA
ncbi:branched-chain amino acid ABC transporter permease [Bradyrhizobium uaiense]|uniref:Branched-chain amino acid ABC transporter permease n=1 Tax=Bradyrhizobium uaiense TaxID=2594946 RepID=A0A6P1BLV9_9BRAD|nr:branched-chain amino acid ABC transporter permease [Bradyrhizobium uaiense]NEU99193.1 branched-chain amino acid ABC transporter permease [Bradyrhizobium uaiense]